RLKPRLAVTSSAPPFIEAYSNLDFEKTNCYNEMGNYQYQVHSLYNQVLYTRYIPLKPSENVIALQ
ncbi:MAG: hypothetical protein ACLUVG_21190, partial [Phocaeicola vulgatus]